MDNNHFLYLIFDRLLNEYGKQNWWPADTPFEMMLGAILTQNTAWPNVERAVNGLKELTSLDPLSISALSEKELQGAIRPSGYFRQKAGRVRALCIFCLQRYGGDIARMNKVGTDQLREELLSLHGIGPETADSILLYALNRPVFVVDAYTVRLCSRLGLCDGGLKKYEQVQSLFTDNLEPDVKTFNEYHALIVIHGKQKCRKQSPKCEDCPLCDICAFT
jgi:endonuclease-3 related protein